MQCGVLHSPLSRPLQDETAVNTQSKEDGKFRKEDQHRQSVPEGVENKVPSRRTVKTKYIFLH